MIYIWPSKVVLLRIELSFFNYIRNKPLLNYLFTEEDKKDKLYFHRLKGIKTLSQTLFSNPYIFATQRRRP